MKKVVMLSLAMAFSAVIFSSCKKDHTCSCTTQQRFLV